MKGKDTVSPTMPILEHSHQACPRLLLAAPGHSEVERFMRDLENNAAWLVSDSLRFLLSISLWTCEILKTNYAHEFICSSCLFFRTLSPLPHRKHCTDANVKNVPGPARHGYHDSVLACSLQITMQCACRRSTMYTK